MKRITTLLLFLCLSPAYAADGYSRAMSFINDMEYDKAIAEIQQHLQTYPKDVDALHLLARSYAWSNQYDQANRIYDQLLKLEHDNTQYLFGKAQALIWLNKSQSAIPLLDEVRKNAPPNPDVWRLQIMALQQSNNPEDKQLAKQLGQEAKELFPKIYWEGITN